MSVPRAVHRTRFRTGIPQVIGSYYNSKENHLAAKPPKEAYLYFPKLNNQSEVDQFQIEKSNTPQKGSRCIFEGNAEDNYSEDEKKYFWPHGFVGGERSGRGGV